MYKISFCLLICFSTFLSIYAQDEKPPQWSTLMEEYKIKVGVGFQLWSTFTSGQEIYNNSNNKYQTVDNRWNNQIRRIRVGLTGNPYQRLKFKFTSAVDFVGRDAFSATQGGNNNLASPRIVLWNAYVQWKAFENKDGLHLTFGYQSPNIGRANITGAFSSTSFEKSWSQNYLRRNIMGVGPGRIMGLNLGGQHVFSQTFAWSYDLGFFTNQAFGSLDNSQGENAAPLIVGRGVLHIGDREFQNYSTSHKVNYFGKRNGVSLAVASSYQGETDLFDRNAAVGFDILFNHGQFNLDGEWTAFYRNKTLIGVDSFTESNGGYIRGGYNIAILNAYFLEPVLMYVWYNGPMDLDEQAEANRSNSFTGSDRIIDIGLNLHFNPKLKLSLFYTINSGESGNQQQIQANNNFFVNSNGETIRRGNLLGLGLAASF